MFSGILHAQLGLRYNIIHDQMPINEYEDDRCIVPANRYRLLPAPRQYRHSKLREFGYTYQEITETANRADRMRKARERSVQIMRMKKSLGLAWKKAVSF